MEYRTTTFEEEGFDSPEQEHESMRSYVTHLMETTDPNDMMDSLLIISNICELRAVGMQPYNGNLATWYRTTAQSLRACLALLTSDKDAPKPNAKLEDTLLYYPEPEITH